MMNDTQFVESARFLAQRLLAERMSNDQRSAAIFWEVLRRPASEREVGEIATTAASFREIYQESPEAARQLVTQGDSPTDEALDVAELATWTMVANTLMNRDDFVNK